MFNASVGEPMICSPTDALNMFFGSDLEYLIMEDILVVKDGVEGSGLD
jgi:carbamoyltransferase